MTKASSTRTNLVLFGVLDDMAAYTIQRGGSGPLWLDVECFIDASKRRNVENAAREDSQRSTPDPSVNSKANHVSALCSHDAIHTLEAMEWHLILICPLYSVPDPRRRDDC